MWRHSCCSWASCLWLELLVGVLYSMTGAQDSHTDSFFVGFLWLEFELVIKFSKYKAQNKLNFRLTDIIDAIIGRKLSTSEYFKWRITKKCSLYYYRHCVVSKEQHPLPPSSKVCFHIVGQYVFIFVTTLHRLIRWGTRFCYLKVKKPGNNGPPSSPLRKWRWQKVRLNPEVGNFSSDDDNDNENVIKQ